MFVIMISIEGWCLLVVFSAQSVWSLVHTETFPYVSFMGQTLSNHFYVDLSTVGNQLDSSDSGMATLYHGDWYFPDGERISKQ